MLIHPILCLLSKRIDRYLFIPLAFAVTLFLFSSNHHAFPGASASLIVQAANLTPATQETHPLFTAITHLIASLPFSTLPVRLNLFAMICACVSVPLFYRLLAQAIFIQAYDPQEDDSHLWEEESTEEGAATPKHTPSTLLNKISTFNRRLLSISITTSLASTLLLCVTAPFWLSATHINTQIFDVMVVLLVLTLFPKHETPLCHYRFLFAGILYTLGLFESIAYVLLLPVMANMAFRFYMAAENRGLTFAHTILGGMVGVMLSFWLRPLSPETLQPEFLLNFEHFLKIIVYHHLDEGELFFLSKGWLLLLIQTALPTTVLLMGKSFMFDRWSGQTKIACILILVVATPALLNLSFSPFTFLQEADHIPVFSSLIIISVLAFVLAASRLFFVPKSIEPRLTVSQELNTPDEAPPKPSETPALTFIILFIVLALTTPFRSGPYVSAWKSHFADRIAREMVLTMGERTWLVTNGHLDDHLRIQAHLLGKPLNLIILRQQDEPVEVQTLSQAIVTDPAFNHLNHPRLLNALSIGTLRFTMEWINSDSNICQKVMIFANPEMWSMCKYHPVPEGLAFGAYSLTNSVDPQSYINITRSYAETLAPNLLDPDSTACPVLLRLSALLRLKMGFAANELGVLLEEMGRTDEAFAAYQRANQIDPDNVSALLNTYAMAKGGKVKSCQVETIKQRLRTLLKDQAQSALGLQGVFLNYGTIHQKSFYQLEADTWIARGAEAIAKLKAQKAIGLVQQTNAQTLSERAYFYFISGNAQQAEACYRAALEQDPSDFDALYGMTLLMINNNDVPAAEKWLARAAATKKKDKEAILLYPTILLSIRKGNKERTEQLLAEATATYPELEQFWKLRATYHLKQGDLILVRHKILPEMTKALKNPEHYLIHIVRGLLLKQQGSATYRDARISLLKGLSLNASMTEAWNSVLEVDMLIGSLELMESDIRHLLTLEPDHAQANYMKGSIQLARGKISSAEDFIRRSIEKSPSAVACNDLAEILRRQKKLKEAREYAQQAVMLDPKLAYARATLAAILSEIESEQK